MDLRRTKKGVDPMFEGLSIHEEMKGRSRNVSRTMYQTRFYKQLI